MPKIINPPKQSTWVPTLGAKIINHIFIVCGGYQIKNTCFCPLVNSTFFHSFHQKNSPLQKCRFPNFIFFHRIKCKRRQSDRDDSPDCWSLHVVAWNENSTHPSLHTTLCFIALPAILMIIPLFKSSFCFCIKKENTFPVDDRK